MVLRPEDIRSILLNRPNKNLLDAVTPYTKKLMMHITGAGLKDYIKCIDGFERPGAHEIRLKYTDSNRDLFARIHRPIDKVFSARGGSAYYNLPEREAKQFRQILGSVDYGYSIRKWMETFWRQAYHYDPMGLIYIEIDAQGEAYPTYKSVLDIYDYSLKGRNLEYVIFKTDQRIERAKTKRMQTLPNGVIDLGNGRVSVPIYRIVDDAFDYLVEWDGSNYRTIKDQTFPNYFMKVPGMIVSDLYDPLRGYFISPDDDIVEKADTFLREGSVKSIFKNYFGFPKAWQYESPCPTCSTLNPAARGEGVLNGQKCPDCGGTGLKAKHNVWEIITVPVPDKDQQKLPPDIAGYVTPDVEGWGKMTEELQLLEEIMYRTFWGTHQLDKKEKGKNETATGEFIDVQPVNDRLNKFSDAAEYVEDFVVDLLGQFYFGISYKGADINYGRRFLIEGPDEVWKKYQEARKNGAPNSTLDGLLIDYYQTKYQNDSIEMQRHIKLMRVEPFVHLSIQEMRSVSAPRMDYLKKLYFNEWLAVTPENKILITSVKDLIADLEAYIKPKYDQDQQEQRERMEMEQNKTVA